MNKISTHFIFVISLSLLTMYMSSLVRMSLLGQIATLGLTIFWIAYFFVILARLLLRFIRNRKSQNMPESAGPLNSRSSVIGFCIALSTIVVTRYEVFDLRVRLSKSELLLVANTHLQTPGTIHNAQRIGLLDVKAIISDKDGVWFRTFRHPDGAFGVMYSTTEKAPQPEDDKETIKTRALGDGWFTYSVYWLD